MDRSKLLLVAAFSLSLLACDSNDYATTTVEIPTGDIPNDIEGPEQTFVVQQAPPTLVSIDLGVPGGTRGDVIAFDAAISVTDTDGLSGTLSGLITTVDIEEGSTVVQDRIGELVFDFGNTGTLVVSGKSVYPYDATGTEQMSPGNPQQRAIVGGTGQFLGALGHVDTVRNEDSSYSHTINAVGIQPWRTSEPAPSDQQIIMLQQGVADMVHVDLGAPGGSHGDLMTFAAPVTSTELNGVHRGMIVTAAIPEPGSSPFQDRIVKSVFSFGPGTSLTMFGRSPYAIDSQGLDEVPVDQPIIKPIVGGTGDFVGTRGQVITVRLQDDSYTQELQLVGTSQPGTASDVTLVIDQALPFITDVDIGVAGGSHGDVLAFDAEVTSSSGLLGNLSGLVTTVSLPSPNEAPFKNRIVNMVFDFGEGNTVVVMGISSYPFNGSHISEFEVNVPQTRSIVGGTGNYSAAQGQVTTVRNTDSSYQHTLLFTGDWLPNTP